MKKVLITGSNGNIGNILKKSLEKNYDLTLADLPECDLRDYKTCLKIVEGKDAVIHLAWNSKTENFQNGRIDPDNALMFYNIYRASLEKKVGRVVMASSVHADDFRKPTNGNLTPEKSSAPTSPYGADKILMESLGKYYSENGLEVVCIRFGVPSSENPGDREGEMLWLSARDCIDLVKTIIDARKIQGNFFVMYGVSDNKNRVHSFDNPLGWKPRDGFGKK